MKYKRKKNCKVSVQSGLSIGFQDRKKIKNVIEEMCVAAKSIETHFMNFIVFPLRNSTYTIIIEKRKTITKLIISSTVFYFSSPSPNSKRDKFIISFQLKLIKTDKRSEMAVPCLGRYFHKSFFVFKLKFNNFF